MNPQFGQGFLQPHGFGRTSAPHRRQRGVLGDPGDPCKEGIRGSFASDGGFWPMPTVHDGIVGQREQLALDAGDQRLEVAAGQVGPSN